MFERAIRAMDTQARAKVRYGIINYPMWPSCLPVPVGIAALVQRVAHRLGMLLRHQNDPHVIAVGEAVE